MQKDLKVPPLVADSTEFQQRTRLVCKLHVPGWAMCRMPDWQQRLYHQDQGRSTTWMLLKRIPWLTDWHWIWSHPDETRRLQEYLYHPILNNHRRQASGQSELGLRAWEGLEGLSKCRALFMLSGSDGIIGEAPRAKFSPAACDGSACSTTSHSRDSRGSSKPTSYLSRCSPDDDWETS